ncbi:MAG TPA: HlyC/CorC family transporter [Chitinophagaceae bacterium]|jgi:putative hemolysin|nr:HlyC/CorC family transporter [Chitinophagaceae bacterium]
MTELYTIVWIIASLILIGFFAGYEIAFVSANRLSIELKKKQGKQSGLILSDFVENPAKFIGTCLIGLNTVLVVYGLLFDEFLKGVAWNPLNVKNEYLKLIIDTIISAVVVLIFGEFIPKAIFRARNDSLLSFFAPVAKFFHTIFEPLTNLFVNLSQWILKYIFNVRVNDKTEAFTKVDLEHFFQQTKEQDEDSQELNTELFENALSLPTIKIRQCLVPRTEIEGVDKDISIEDLRQRFVQTKLSKLLIFDENIDNILGYVHQTDLFKKPSSIQQVLHPILAVPESMSAADLINKFTKERKSIAWVVDEFGGTAGIVTMEDLLEEIFGEIHDEYDVEEFVEKQLAEDEFIFSGRLELDYLKEKYNLEFPENDSETLSGYIIQKHESIPTQKETIIIDDYRFDILSVSETRIDTVKMKILR